MTEAVWKVSDTHPFALLRVQMFSMHIYLSIFNERIPATNMLLHLLTRLRGLRGPRNKFMCSQNTPSELIKPLLSCTKHPA